MEALTKLMAEFYSAGNPDRVGDSIAEAEDRKMGEWAVDKAFRQNSVAVRDLNGAITVDPTLYKAARAYLDSWWEYFGDGGFSDDIAAPFKVTRENPTIRPYRPALRYLSVVAMSQ